jgi:methanesulfonate monooxygenase large subunit
MAKSAADWDAPPKFPATHYVDSRIYTDEAIFEEEKEKLFKPSWIIACHESEIANPFDYRLFTHPSGVPLIVVRGDDQKVQHLPAPRQHHPVRPGRQR